jgi:hypothetical protein
MLKKISRLTVFLLATAAVLLYVDYRMARASVMDRLIGIGTRMAPYLDDGRFTEAPRQVRINGVRLHVAAGHTEHPPSFVKKWYQDRYASKGDGLDDFSKELKKRNVLPPDAPALNQLVFGNDEVGGVAAIDYGEKLSAVGFKERLERFIGSGKLGSIGRLRYVWVEKNGQGGTRFLTVWTDESFDLEKLMPQGRKDADGADLEDVPRFPGTVRVLSAEERGMPQRLAVYDGPGSPETAELFYKARMSTLGWEEDTTFGDLAKRQGKRSLKFGNKKGHEVVLDLSDASGGTGVTVVAMQTR